MCVPSASARFLFVSSGLLLVIDEMDQSVVAFGDGPAKDDPAGGEPAPAG